MDKRVFALLMIFWPLVLMAQVRGIVKDVDGAPVIGANVVWQDTSNGTSTDTDGKFSIRKPSNAKTLIISFLGYVTQEIKVQEHNQELTVVLQEDATVLNEVEVRVRNLGLGKLTSSVLNTDQITAAQLTRAACCNLGESFTSNASVDVNYSDASTGAKQIKLLGLSGTYVQMLTENIPNYRGAAMPFALGYIPGPWMQSIQVSKGTASVKNGYEAITGQINVEFKKPQAEPSVAVNLYMSSRSKFEANFDANTNLGKRWNVGVMGHYEDYSKMHDENGDGFQDMPNVKQYSLQNRWAYMGDNYVFQASIKGMKEDRSSGQAHTVMTDNPYKIAMDVERYEAFTKNAYIFDKERNGNVALILSGSVHNLDSKYGFKSYDVKESNLYASLMYESEFGSRHSVSTGLSLNYDRFDQHGNQFRGAIPTALLEKETVPGVYAQYTYNQDDKLILMGGIRADHSSMYGTFITPRAHIKWAPTPILSLRASAGKGYRTNHVMAEYNNLMASNRVLVYDVDKLKQEKAWNYGFSALLDIPVTDSRNLTLNAEYYYTNFQNQMVVDMDSDVHTVQFSNLQGKSFSHTMQLETSYPLIEGMDFTAAYRYTDVKQTIAGKLMERPLTPKHKGVFSVSYKPGMGIWQFDVTLQLNSGGRMPTPDKVNPLWDERYKGYEQITAQVTRWFRNWSIYIGGENLTGFKQKNPFIAASNPWGNDFDSTMVWGPVDGAMFYVGVRINFTKFAKIE